MVIFTALDSRKIKNVIMIEMVLIKNTKVLLAVSTYKIYNPLITIISVPKSRKLCIQNLSSKVIFREFEKRWGICTSIDLMQNTTPNKKTKTAKDNLSLVCGFNLMTIPDFPCFFCLQAQHFISVFYRSPFLLSFF